jgi:hypothetical protein
MCTAEGAREQERAGTGVDAARAGGVTLMHERHANQAALGRSSRRGGTRAEENRCGSVWLRHGYAGCERPRASNGVQDACERSRCETRAEASSSE